MEEKVRSRILKHLADTLMRLPSTFKEDYPRSVPNYVLRDWERFANQYKTNIGYVKNTLKSLQSQLKQKDAEIAELKEFLREACEELWWSCKYDESLGFEDANRTDGDPEVARYDSFKDFLGKTKIKEILGGGE